MLQKFRPDYLKFLLQYVDKMPNSLHKKVTILVELVQVVRMTLELFFM